MRSVLALLTGIIAVIMFGLAVPSWWLAGHVNDPDGFATLMEPAEVDEQMHESLAAETSDVVADDAPSAEVESIESAITRIVRSAASTAEFTSVWDRILRSSHRATFDDDSPNVLVMDLSPLVDVAVDELEDDTGFELSPPDDAAVALSDEPHDNAVAIVRHSSTAQWWLSVAAVVFGFASIRLSRVRASSVFSLALGCLAMIVLLKLTADQLVPSVLARGTADSQIAHHTVSVISRQITMSFHDTLTYLGVSAALIAAAAGVTRVIRSGDDHTPA